MSKAGMIAGIRIKKLAGVTALLVLAAQPVFAYELKQEIPQDDNPTFKGPCGDKGPYKTRVIYYRNLEPIKLRCGKTGPGGWGWRHIKEKHGWNTTVKTGTALTIFYGKVKEQNKQGSYRNDHKFTSQGAIIKWRVIVQKTKTFEGEPKPKGVITSHQRKN
jgi:hypothetical protein